MASHTQLPDPAAGVLRVGLTGGIGSGKSTVAALWARQGRHVIDLDAIARKVLDEPGPGVDETLAAFGEAYQRGDTGTIDRSALAAHVFADPEARKVLEGIVHAHVYHEVARLEQQFSQAAAQGTQFLVIHDSPLLFENCSDAAYLGIIAVMTQAEERIERVMRERGKSREYVQSIINAQVCDEERIRRADVLIDNTGSPADLAERADAALAEICDLIDDRLFELS